MIVGLIHEVLAKGGDKSSWFLPAWFKEIRIRIGERGGLSLGADSALEDQCIGLFLALAAMLSFIGLAISGPALLELTAIG